MQKPLLLAAFTALSLTACNSKPETIETGTVDPTANQVASLPPVELPPAVAASRTYRCRDNSLVYVDFFDNGTLANLRTDKAADPVVLNAPAKGEAYVAEGGYSVGANAAETSIALAGKSAQSCKA